MTAFLFCRSHSVPGLSGISRLPGILSILIFLPALLHPSHAHECGGEITIIKGQRGQIEIKADVMESEPSQYSLTDLPDPSVAILDPGSPISFAAVEKGVWRFIGVEVGQSTATATWAYAPNQAGGSCGFIIKVIDPEDEDSEQPSTNYSSSIMAGDPVHTLTGEFIYYGTPELILGGPMNLHFIRFYSSGMRKESLFTSSLGINWSHNFDYKLFQYDNLIEILLPGAEKLQFQSTPDGWVRSKPTNISYQLNQHQENSWILVDPESNYLFQFNSAGFLDRICDLYQNFLQLKYSGGVLSEIEDNFGRKLFFEYSGLHHLSAVTDGSRRITFFYSGGLLILATDALGNQTQYDYDFANPIPGLLTKTVLPKGNTPLTQIYDPTGRVIEQKTADGGTFTYSYQSGSTTMIDPVGRTTVYHYNPDGSIQSVDLGDGISRQYTYSPEGRMIATQLNDGQSLTQELDPVSGEPLKATSPDGFILQAQYTRIQLDKVSIPRRTNISYDEDSNRSFNYDDKARLISSTDALGNQTLYTYNAQSQISHITNPLGGMDQFTYDNFGNLTSWTNPAGNTTSHQYDTFHRINKVIESGTITVELTYNNNDRITSSKNEAGQQIRLIYDANGNLIQYTGTNGAVTKYSYDSMDRLTSINGPKDYSKTYEYDLAGRVIKVTDSSNGAITISYDTQNNPIKIIDETGKEWTQTFSKNGHLVSQTGPTGEKIEFEVDWEGVIHKAKLGGNGEYQFLFDAHKNPIGAVDSQGNQTQVKFNQAGRLMEWIDANGKKILYDHDALGNITRISHENEASRIYQYDNAGRLARETDPLGHLTEYTYNNRDRISRILHPGNLGVTTVNYDIQGNTSSIQHSGGKNIEFSHSDIFDSITSDGIHIQWDKENGNLISSNGIDATYDSENRLMALTYMGQNTVQYKYNPAGLLTEITDWLGHSTNITYDSANNIHEIQRNNGLTTQFTTNAKGINTRKTESFNGLNILDIQIEYDSQGRIRTVNRQPRQLPTLPDSPEKYQFDAAHQNTQMVYDATGRLISDGKNFYQWDSLNRLISISDGSQTLGFQHDAAGYPTTQSSNGTTQNWLWNYTTSLPTLFSIDDTSPENNDWQFIYTPTGILLYGIHIPSATKFDYLYDERGNTTLILGPDGSIHGQYTYDPYGRLMLNQESIHHPFKFQGSLGHLSLFDMDNLVLMRARVYDSNQGRFLTRDPEGRFHGTQQLNPYSYGRNNPITFSDPNGRDAYIVQTSAIHTELAVDIYDANGTVIGVAQFDFNPDGSVFGFSNKGVVKGVYYKSLADNPKNAHSIRTQRLTGTPAQDIRLLNKMQEMQGFDNSSANFSGAQLLEFFGPTARSADERLCIMKKMGFKSISDLINFQSGSLQTYGDYSLYPGKSRYCNQFVNDMLDTYFGANWPSTVTLLPAELLNKAGAFQAAGEGTLAWAAIHVNNINPFSRVPQETASVLITIFDSIFNE